MIRLTKYNGIAVGLAALGALWGVGEMVDAPRGSGGEALEISSGDFEAGDPMAWRMANPIADVETPDAPPAESIARPGAATHGMAAYAASDDEPGGKHPSTPPDATVGMDMPVGAPLSTAPDTMIDIVTEVDGASPSTPPVAALDLGTADPGPPSAPPDTTIDPEQAAAALALSAVASNNNLGPADQCLEQIKSIACPFLSIMPPFVRDIAGQFAVWGGTTCPMGAAPAVSGTYNPGTGIFASR